MAHQQLIVPVIVHDLPPPLTYKQICQALLKLQQAQHTLIQHLMASIQEQHDAIHALQGRLARLLRHVATLCSSPYPLTFTASAPLGDTDAVPAPRIPHPLPTPLQEFAVPGDQLVRATTEARQSTMEPLIHHVHRGPAPCWVEPPTTTTLEALLPAIRDVDALQASSGSLSGMARAGVQQMDVLPSFFGAPTSAVQPGQHLPVLSSMDTRPRVVHSEDDSGM